MFGLFKSTPDVLVAGAGPVGLYAALNLAQRGIRVAIIDSEWRGTTHSYALALHPRSLELLDEVGVAQAVLDKAWKLRRVGFYDGPERRASLDMGQLATPFPFVAVLPQSEFENLLGKALIEAGVKVHYNHRLARIESEADSVWVEVHELGKESMGYGVAHVETIVERSERVRLPLIIAADGHDSLARKQSHIKFESVRPADHFAVFEFAASGKLPSEICVGLNPKSSEVLWPMRHDRCRASFSLDEDVADWESRDKDRLLVDVGNYRLPQLELGTMHRLIAERAPWFRGKVERVDWRMAVRFEYRLASAFGAGRVWLVGDAAHMAGPVGIHSMNVGLREAHDLCDVYARLLAKSGSERSLDRYNSERLAEWHALLGLGPSQKPAKTADPWVAEHADRLLQCVPASGAHLRALLGQIGLAPPG